MKILMKYYNLKNFKEKDIYSWEEIVATIEDLEAQIEEMEDEIEQLKEELETEPNYEPDPYDVLMDRKMEKEWEENEI